VFIKHFLEKSEKIVLRHTPAGTPKNRTSHKKSRALV
jgi:hypothetical protein